MEEDLKESFRKNIIKVRFDFLDISKVPGVLEKIYMYYLSNRIYFSSHYLSISKFSTSSYFPYLLELYFSKINKLEGLVDFSTTHYFDDDEYFVIELTFVKGNELNLEEFINVILN